MKEKWQQNLYGRKYEENYGKVNRRIPWLKNREVICI